MLNGNNPRFPWKPSTTMLDLQAQRHYRGFRCPTGTNEPILAIPLRAHHSPPKPEPPPGIFANHGEPKGLYIAELQIYGCAARDLNPEPAG